MGTPPPNFGYTPQAPPVAPNPRTQRAQQRAQQKAQQRAADVQMRLAREQARLRMRALQRRSIIGPILLLAVGLLLLLLQTGRLHWTDLLTWLSFWWPAILIGTGALMILEWALDTRLSARGGAPAPRRILGGAATALLLLLSLTGASLSLARRNASFFRDLLSAPWIGNGRNNWSELLNAHSDFTSDEAAPLSPAGELTIENPHGDVTVTGSSQDGQVHVSVHQHLFALEHEDLAARHTQEEPHFHGNRDHLILTSLTQGDDDTDLTVQLPHNASLVIRSGKGDVSVEELHGAAAISAHKGDVNLTALRGPVQVDSADDDNTIKAHSLSGGLTLNGHSGDINLSDIDGGVALRGDFYGTTQLERVRGNVSFQSSFTRFDCAGIPGNLVIDGRSDLNARHLLGPLTLATTDRDLSLDGVRGAATITDRNGSVALTLAAPLQPVRVTNTNGTVNVSVPDRQPFTLHAQVHDAEIHNDFNLPVAVAGSTTLVNGQVLGGGPELNLQTSDDNIQIHRLPAADKVSWTDTPSTGTLESQVNSAKNHRSHPR